MRKNIGSNTKGFTLLEILVVVAIIGILSSITLMSLSNVRGRALLSKAHQELKSVRQSLELYFIDYKSYPEDTERHVPPGLEKYLSPGIWPNAAWPGSVFDWDNWTPDNLSHAPKNQVYQISIRFCPIGEPSSCEFPNNDWATNFDYFSSVYYCISGPCRAHSSKPCNHPGYCVNCPDNTSPCAP
jgi:prepilin-type N-terminal cleavage/methylation domain-containing protein